ncbi:MAG: hypothetical protein IJU98_06765, partial [Synergistaceae bacterium]|nr:hypothetical protein [Synergistaceae bacterium]
GDWLYVNYYDTHMGQTPARNTGDYPILAISSKDGSAVSVTDVKGSMTDGTNTESVHLSELLGLSTGVQGNVCFYEDDGTFTDDAKLDNENYVFSITVAGYTHQIDTGAMRDSNSNGGLDVGDLVDTINARMQDYDVRAELNGNGELVLWSPRGYSIEVNMSEVNGVGTVTDSTITKDFFGATNNFGQNIIDSDNNTSTYYRGGYNLEASVKYTDSVAEEIVGGIERTSPGIHSQNATIRSGANTTRQNAFGMIDDVIAAVKSGNRDEIAETMLPRIDSFINNILSVMSTNGALVNRYEANIDRQAQNNLIMTEEHDNLVRPDYSEVASQLLLANSVYEANLAIIARLIQPSLLDFLS